MKKVKDYTFAAVLAGMMALPMAAQAEGPTDTMGQPGGKPNQLEQAFQQIDTDQSGAISEAEYIVHAKEAKNEMADQAVDEFAALDTDKDKRLTLAELQTAR